MNMVYGTGGDGAGGDFAAGGRPVAIGTDERRMHVRAYNYWVSLLKGRAYPSIDDLDPGNIADFGGHSVLLDFTGSSDDPAIQYLGDTLREECGVESSIRRISEVPNRSLLSRLTDHYRQIIANRAPIGFDAEFVGQQGHNTLYRGILLPFSSDGEAIDFLYGVINWKVTVDADTQARLVAEVEAARRELPHIAADAPSAWADGPSGGFDLSDHGMPAMDVMEEDDLHDLLAHARACAEDAVAAEAKARIALHRALERAYLLAQAAERRSEAYAELLGEAGILTDRGGVMAPAVELVFGPGFGRQRLDDFAAVLAEARAAGIDADDLGQFLSAKANRAALS